MGTYLAYKAVQEGDANFAVFAVIVFGAFFIGGIIYGILNFIKERKKDNEENS